ncbi:MAG: RluA family pseudouridine synthase, partial [Alphaproteobacteria bacterium]
MPASLMEPLVVELPEGCAPRLDKALAGAVPPEAGLSRSRLRALIEGGAVRRAGAGTVREPGGKVKPGEVYEIAVPEPAPAEPEAQDIPLAVVHEDDHIVVVDKPAGMVVHPAPGAESGTLVNALLHRCGGGLAGIGGARRPGIVHRIDKDTSGLLVVAKTDAAHAGLSAQFAAHDIERVYLAVVRGHPGPGDPRLAGLAGVMREEGGLRIETGIGRHRSDRKRMAVLPGGRRAVTHLRLRERLEGAALIECRLETGRTHQIRVHLAHIGHPLIGDPVYG